ncbi:hypothetical protein F511_19360 [Dorcoceras hygrometricum]|uniref:DUF632 domain-containing protein n=1 Tax=Dorcoceras hygrometricum TaxID=472368 RepID=A0A2Z7CIG5_9LAMI|nr:hypothetical protein F511_19360 [Dorcoceras hygrometricum]
MGASSSRLEEDKGLQLCRARKKFIKQALNGRCSVAEAHIAYIEELKILGVALRRFVELDHAQVDSFANHSRNGTPEPSQTDGATNMLPSLTPQASNHRNSHHMKFSTTSSKKIEEKPPAPVSVTVTPCYSDAPETSFEIPPWDFFGLFNPVGNHFSSQEGREIDQCSEYSDGVQEDFLSPQESEDDFDEPSSATLVRSFKNINREMKNDCNLDSSRMAPESVVPMVKLPSFENVYKAEEFIVNEDSTFTSSESVTLEAKCVNGKNNICPDLSQLKKTSSNFVEFNDVNITPVKSEVEGKMAPKDIFSSMKNIEQLFFKASESGKEVPRMLEAHKFQFRQVFPAKASGSVASPLIKSCFSCGDDPSEIQEEPPQNSVKYLTWPRTTSSHYASSQKLLDATFDNSVDLSNNLFDNFCMVSGSHASTLDRLYAWEKKLYDEVKADELLRSNFDQKCKFLRLLESRGHSTEKARSVVKDLHSRIRVSIHRIKSISKKIEEIRDEELQPQLEELIEGLIRMWETMLECHNLQLHIATISHRPGSTKPSVQSDSQRQITSNLENELNSLSSSFTKWLGAQKIYIEAIDKWLFKCVLLPQNTSKRNRRMKPPPVRNSGPPIYMICGAWLEMINELPSKGVVNSIRDLAAEVAHFLPHQEKSNGNSANLSCKASLSDGPDGDLGVNMSRDRVSEDHAAVSDRFHTRLVGFLGCLKSFAECSVKKLAELQKAIREAKNNHEYLKSQQKEISSKV